MPAYDDKMKQLLETAVRAVGRASKLDESEWSDSESRNRLQEVVAYAELVIEGSDGALVSHAAESSLEATLLELVDAPQQVAVESEPWMERLLDQLGRLPRAQGRDFEQAAKKRSEDLPAVGTETAFDSRGRSSHDERGDREYEGSVGGHQQ